MPDDTATDALSAELADEKRVLSTAIYTGWRNQFLNEIPVDLFNRIEAAAPHLIDAIAKHL